ncbi:MAG: glycosyltransferase [Bacteroidales bacterium]|jgi:glycosyltransferase involved in cell wall biosynthesis|nr:glycosyltransferase [Bacteroidales bacterium]
MQYSIIIPVYNRPQEMEELLQSLSLQTENNFEVVVVEDGSKDTALSQVEKYRSEINIHYVTKPNTGRSDTRNVGIANAKGEYFLFFDSDCILPSEYIATLNKRLREHYVDCFGGPDNALDTFTSTQKAVNYAMTSFLTTGGIRGSRSVRMEKFNPRSFNMGFSRAVYEKVGGFKDMLGEDIDLSIRIHAAGFSTALLQDVYVYHKRRLSLKRFYRQVFNFGKGRVILYKLYPHSLKIVHCLPAMFVTGEIGLIALSIFHSLYWLIPAGVYISALFIDALCRTRSIAIAGKSIITSLIQLNGYGLGFWSAFWDKIIMKRPLEQGAALTKMYNK